MIRPLQKADINSVAEIWLDANRKAHAFIPASYWERNFASVKEMLPQAEVYVYETENAQKQMFYDICIKVPGNVVHIDAAEYEYKMFRKEHNCFIYRRIDASKWYLFAESLSGKEIRNLD